MTHQECTQDIALNLDVLGREHKGAKIAAITIVEKSTADIEAEIKRILNDPFVPANSVKNKDYGIAVVFNTHEYTSNEHITFLRIENSLSELELEELLVF
ncbi:MAG TPA: hypothetical protein VHA56_13925 [Mucilaginibacter sp.]|nr:hypothetical protein [Mucilaginibacter sp.]